jgi:hypothetical protein
MRVHAYEEEDTFMSRRSSSCSLTRVGKPFSGGCSPPETVCKEEEDTCMAYEEEDICMSYEEEDTCMSYEEEDTCMSYEEDTCMSYEEEDTYMF